MSGIIALLTDFGLKDGFTGAVKGVIKSINKDVDIIDISHEITSFDILEGSLVLNSVYKYFPEKTIFVAVVDPGVGTERKPVLIETDRYFFISPDNGILTLPLKNEKVKRIVHITNEKYMLNRETDTFHGRDIFAPVAAYLSKGINIEEFGTVIEDYKKIDFPEPYFESGYLIGEIIKFDKFGNGITNLQDIPDFEEIIIKNYRVNKICRNFLEGEEDKPNLIKGSFGFYEIFLPKKSAEEHLNLKLHEKIKIKLKR
ncbi:hypothetical protein SAMN06265182_2097 [Persephonella hydrogeniphila]|uniref:S-adenosyl-l-methionine hydroxide adenosyltransferase n=1 Tax=Persephonella hydrogeniphila TaxID=198703 RepID=A0A285NQZ6_9AQUI|nr:SAM-dependent chlorinase/fluorinase [Persephonella hydrogeniphila]SNZ11628.1 hypothetical protein SAMN06265182_2097 [Persephonella hydrogeniphila]